MRKHYITVGFQHTVGFLFLLLMFASPSSVLNTAHHSEGTTIQALSTFPTIPDSELHALWALYNSTRGFQWLWRTTDKPQDQPWNFSVPNPNPCLSLWIGVTCTVDCFILSPKDTDNNCHIVALELDGQRMDGDLPVALSNLTLINSISFADNKLRGRIPGPAFANLTHLQYLDLSGNFLMNSTIPNMFSELQSLQVIDLSRSSLYGTIPPSIYSLVANLTYLDLGANVLTGPVSSRLCDMKYLQYLIITYNYLTGSLPDCIGKMSNLINFFVGSNYFTSTMPSTLGLFENLISFSVIFNFFTGPFPTGLMNITTLENIQIEGNMFTGTLPKNIGYGNQPGNCLPNLKIFSVYTNEFYGNIPNFTLPLTFFEIASNFLTGSFPEQFNTTMMLEFTIQSNFLTGQLPPFNHELRYILDKSTVDEILSLEPVLEIPGIAFYLAAANNRTTNFLYYVNTSANFFTGSLPSWIFTSPFLSYCYMFDNLYTGSIPNSVDIGESYDLLLNVTSNFSALSILYLDDNYLTGTIPDTIINQQHLLNLRLASNQLHGTIPREIFFNNSKIIEFSVEYNNFHGPLPNLQNLPFPLLDLKIFSVSNNQLTGKLPIEYFSSLKYLGVFAASTNCLSGTIPEEICQANLVHALILDGMTSADSCQIPIFPWTLPGVPELNSFVLKHGMIGTIPSCLLEMPILESLYLSGNGLTGTIPSDVNISSTLRNLRLSHNKLEGSIPHSVQRRSWNILDLSYNKLTGHLVHKFGTENEFNPNLQDYYEEDRITSDQVLYLDVNRLSGKIPKPVLNIHNIKVLNGNIFFCGFGRNTELPEHDPKYHSYNCAAVSFYQDAFALIVLILLILCFLIWMKYKAGNVKERILTPLRQLLEQWNIAYELAESRYFFHRQRKYREYFLQAADCMNEKEDADDEGSYQSDHLESNSSFLPQSATSSTPIEGTNNLHSRMIHDVAIGEPIRLNQNKRLSKKAVPASKDFQHHSQKRSSQSTLTSGPSMHKSNQSMLTGSLITDTTSTIGGPSFGSFNTSLRFFYAIRRYCKFVFIGSLFLLLPGYRVLNIFASMFEQKYAWEYSAIYMTGVIAGSILFILFFFMIVWAFYYFFIELRPLQTHQHTSTETNTVTTLTIGGNSSYSKPSSLFQAPSQYSQTRGTAAYTAGSSIDISSVNAVATTPAVKRRPRSKQSGDENGASVDVDSSAYDYDAQRRQTLSTADPSKRFAESIFRRSSFVMRQNSMQASSFRDRGFSLADDSKNGNPSSSQVIKRNTTNTSSSSDNPDDTRNVDNPDNTRQSRFSVKIPAIFSARLTTTDSASQQHQQQSSSDNQDIMNSNQISDLPRQSSSMSLSMSSSFIFERATEIAMSMMKNFDRHTILICFIVGMINFICMTLANVGYVITVVYVQDRSLILFAQVILAMTKLCWNEGLLWLLLHTTKYYIHRQWIKMIEKEKDMRILLELTSRETSTEVQLMVCCLLYNNILAPCMSVAIISPSCFYNAFDAAQAIDSHYLYCTTYIRLIVHNGVCTERIEGDTTFNPPFLYSYNCASLLPVNYVAVYLYMVIVGGLLWPLIKVVLKYLYDKQKNEIKRENEGLIVTGTSNQDGKVDWSIKIMRYLDEVMPLSLAVLEDDPRKCLRGSARDILGINDKNKAHQGNDANADDVDGESKDTSKSVVSSPISDAAMIKYLSPIFNRHRFVVRLIGLLALMLSFGMIFPILAIVIVIAIVIITWFEQWNIGRILYEVELRGSTFLWYYDKLAYDLENIVDSLLRALLPMTVVVCLLLAALLFDTFGDKLGSAVGFIVVATYLGLLLLLWLALVQFRTPLVEALNYLVSGGKKKKRTKKSINRRSNAMLEGGSYRSNNEVDDDEEGDEVELRGTTTFVSQRTTNNSSLVSNPMLA